MPIANFSINALDLLIALAIIAVVVFIFTRLR